MKLFVPGRICLFGEHTDWAGGYRRISNEIEKGCAIITGTNQGIYAEVKSHPNKLIYKTSHNEDGSRDIYEINMDRKTLLKEAEKGGFFSYIAGVAYQILTHYHVQGLEIDNYLTDLPVKKGLSSSASVCVLVTRAFNKIYNLKMTTRGEMEIAYHGEIATPSRCGRMDQGCAYGKKPILMIFDGDMIEVHEIKISKPLYFVIADLNANKDTKEILKKLNQCYPFPENEVHHNVQKYLGSISSEVTMEAVKAIEQCDSKSIGELMNKAQIGFDKYVSPACPTELISPVLHKVLNYEPIQKYIYGGKGVGSQGDGSAQFIVKDKESQKKVIEILKRDLSLNCLELEIKSVQKVKKAVIPAAGFGTRLFPSTKAVKKEMFPILDKEGRMKPAIQIIVEEALSANIEEICIIVQKDGKDVFEDYFKNQLSLQNYNKLSKKDKEYYEYLLNIGNKITFIEQETQEGFGHAIYYTKDWINNEPFLLLLGDHLYSSELENSCSKQIVEVYEKIGKTIVSVMPTHISLIHNFGCVSGNWIEKNLLSITEFAEKPEADYAKENLQIEGYEDDTYLSLFGQYIINPVIFDYLKENIEHNFRERGEFQLTSCLERLRKEENAFAYVVSGKRFDIGNPIDYRKTMIEFGQ